MIGRSLILSLAILCAAPAAMAEKVVRAVIRTDAPATSRTEFGVFYSSTGLIPAKLLLYCQEFVTEADWNGVLPDRPRKCGEIDLQIRLTSKGASLFVANYWKNNPLKIYIGVDPEETPIRSVVGTYTGAIAALGAGAGFRSMVFWNDQSRARATAVQTNVPDRSDGKSWYNDFDLGIDLSRLSLEVYLRTPTDLTRSLSSFKNQGA